MKAKIGMTAVIMNNIARSNGRLAESLFFLPGFPIPLFAARSGDNRSMRPRYLPAAEDDVAFCTLEGRVRLSRSYFKIQGPAFISCRGRMTSTAG